MYGYLKIAINEFWNETYIYAIPNYWVFGPLGRRLKTDFRSDSQVVSRSAFMLAIYLLTVFFLTFLIFLSYL
jgi:hypothetical protein